MWSGVFLLPLLSCFRGIESVKAPLTVERQGKADAIADLIKEHLEVPFKIGRNCHVLTYRLDPKIVAKLVKSLESRSDNPTQFYHIDESIGSADSFGERIDYGTWCVIAVAPAKTENIETVEKLVKPCHHRKAIFISDSKKETRRFKHKKVQLPSLILEKIKKRRSKKSDLDDFFIHAICVNCWVAKNSKIDTWKSGRGLFLPTHDYFAKCCFGQSELYGKTLNVSIFGTPPFIIPTETSVKGIDIDILRILATTVKFYVNPVPEKTWAGYVNGTFVGTVASVFKGRSHLGLGHLLMTNDRYEKVDFSLQTYLVQYTYMAHERLPLDPFKNVVAPFENILWTVLSGMVIVVSFAFYIVHKGNLEIEERARIVGKSVHLIDYLIFPLSMMVNQGGVTWFDRCQRWSSGSTIFMVWSLMSFIMNMAYQSNLQASLISVEYEKPIEKIQDFIDRGVDVYHIAGSALLQSLKDSPLKIHRDIYWHVENRGTNYVYTGGVPDGAMDPVIKAKKGGLIASRASHLLWKEEIYKRYGRFPFEIISENLLSGPCGIVVPKHCLWVDHLNRVISALQSSGIMSHFYTRDVGLKWMHLSRPTTTQKVLELRTYYSSFMFLGGMLALSAILFMVERRKGARERREKKLQEALKRPKVAWTY